MSDNIVKTSAAPKMGAEEAPSKRIGGGFGGYDAQESIEAAKADVFTGNSEFEHEDLDGDVRICYLRLDSALKTSLGTLPPARG